MRFVASDASEQRSREPLEKPHLRPLQRQRGIERFQEERRRFSEEPCREGLILSKRRVTSDESEIKEEEEVKKKKKTRTK